MSNLHRIGIAVCGVLLIATSAPAIHGQSDKEVLLELRNFFQAHNPINRGVYEGWSESDASPCHWEGVGCDPAGHVDLLDLSSSNISGPCFGNFSRLTRLTRLDLSANSISGELEADLKRCQSLRYLNLSNNLIGGILDVSSLTNLHTLDVSQNRFQQTISINFPTICGNLTSLSVASNNLTGRINGLFDGCSKLRHVDLSWNSFSGTVWPGISRFTRFEVNSNNLTGIVSSTVFTTGCKLKHLNIASNRLRGNFPSSIANCTGLNFLSVWNNSFSGPIPAEIGSLAGLEELVLTRNRFDGKIPPELKNCTSLKYLDISDNSFAGEIQEVFGKLTNLRNLLLQENNYTGGIISSGILQLPHLSMLGLGKNKFSGELPREISRMGNMKILMLNENNFSGSVPAEYGRLVRLQVLDLSYNSLSGRIPSQIGNLTSLLLLTLAGNQLSGEIPKEIGNCGSLLWLNIVGNRLSGEIPPEMANIGSNPSATFKENRNNHDQLEPITTKCQAVDRWVPASYPEFNYVRSLMMSQKNCFAVWSRLAMGYDPLSVSSPLHTALGYVQLSGNLLSGEIPSSIGRMRSFSLLVLADNRLSGLLPLEIGQLKLVALNVSNNDISGEIPSEIGNMDSLESLDLSWNNFSSSIPTSLNNLTKLSKLNLSYNPLLSGNVPGTGQLSTFDEQSFLGDPLVCLHLQKDSRCHPTPNDFSTYGSEKHPINEEVVVPVIAFLVFFVVTFVIRELQHFMCLYYIVLLKIENFVASLH
ncbi:unnamed protein product [Urochloa decumbens]|uniref:Leucine-rich repeat-containing N-terminal plant-type domain-containing protein n=1 Tax=Urochloa decumbens TaxID=240449 RepID=A0ABC9FNS9_9POAL